MKPESRRDRRRGSVGAGVSAVGAGVGVGVGSGVATQVGYLQPFTRLRVHTRSVIYAFALRLV